MSAQDVDTLRRAYDAFARQDIPAVLEAFQPDIHWSSPDSVPIGGEYDGHDGVVAFFQKLPQVWQELSVEPEQWVDGGEGTIVTIGRIRGRGAGGSIEQPFVHVWTIRDGKAATFAEFGDTARTNQALGVPALAPT